MEYRIMHDSMGEVKVPKDNYWGAQTQRSLENFAIGTETMPESLIYALSVIKLASARVNNKLKNDKMTDEKLRTIETVIIGDILNGELLYTEFPLSVWQTGSGTQTNMNVNEVIANRANELLKKELLHPNDDINMSQSSNDVFPSAMHISAVLELADLITELKVLITAFKKLESQNKKVVKSGRTHLQDATPISFAQEISGWRSSLEKDLELILEARKHLLSLAIGGTAVGTGLNAPKGFDLAVCEELYAITGYKFKPAKNKFHALTSKDEMVYAHGALKALAVDLMKIANDIRWLSSGPRCGLGEISIPENEPGSSIMPGKVNPTQCEAISMIAVQVLGNDATIGFSASQGNFELNVFMPVIIYNFVQSAILLSDGMYSFTENCVKGIKANKKKMKENLTNSLMLVTALSPYIGYEKCAKIAKLAHQKNLSLKEATLSLGYLTEEEFDKYFHPEEMI
ncbi:MAG: class II fumarate hydratase [Clostridia bacterium]|nr:class II fumarate hydratase [Clostridia bacterium]